MNIPRVGLPAVLAVVLVSSIALGDGPKERHEDRKERREDRREERREERKDDDKTGAGEKKDDLKEEWKEKHRAWVEKRKDRREERREELKKKWGDVLEKPAAVAELKKHARRVARLQRVKFLAEAGGKTEIVEKAKTLLEKERARHDKRMETIKSEVAK